MTAAAALTADRVRSTVSAALLALTVLVIVLTATDLAIPGRLLLTVAVALTAPGWAVVSRLRIATPAMEWTIAIAISMSAGLIVSVALLSTGAWAPVPAMLVLLGLTALALLDGLRRSRRPRVTA